MPDSILQQKIFPYDGSQDSTKNPILISPKDIVSSNNIVYTTYSTKKIRPGVSPIFNVPFSGDRTILGCYDYWRLGRQYIVAWDGIDVWAYDPVSQTRDKITGSTSLPQNETVSFCVLSGLLIIFFGGNETPIQAWNQTGSLFDLSSDAPYASFGRTWLNSLWVPDPDVEGRILKSKTGDPTDFTTGDADVVDLDVNDGDPDGITAIFPPFFGSLYVAKRLSVFKITPTILSDGTTIIYTGVKISDGVGCISHNGVVAAEQQIFFPSDYGWHLFQSTNKLSSIDTDLMSINIQPIWTGDTNFARSEYIQTSYDRSLNSILAIFPAASYSYPTDVWGYSLVAQKWYRWQEFNHTSIGRYIDKTNKRVRTMVGSSDGKLGFLDDSRTTDYGHRFGCLVESGLISPAGAPDELFAFNYIAPLFVPQTSGSFTITYKIDGVTIETLTFNMEDSSLGDNLGEDFVTGLSVLGGLPQIKLNKTRMSGYGMIYQVFIEYSPPQSERVTEDTEELEEVGFELLGLFVDVSPVSKGIGERVA